MDGLKNIKEKKEALLSLYREIEARDNIHRVFTGKFDEPRPVSQEEFDSMLKNHRLCHYDIFEIQDAILPRQKRAQGFKFDGEVVEYEGHSITKRVVPIESMVNEIIVKAA